MDCLLQFDLTQ